MFNLSSRHKNILYRVLLSVVFCIPYWGHVLNYWHIPVVDQIDQIIYDSQIRWNLKDQPTDERIVILDIDEKSLGSETLGRWPWSRDKMATIVNTLFDDYDISVLAFDVVFAEPDTSSGLPRLKQLAANEFKNNADFARKLTQLEPQLDFDGRFEQAILGRPLVMGYYFNAGEAAQKSGGLPAPVLIKEDLQGLDHNMPQWNGFGSSLPRFADAALVSGHFNPVVDLDGIVRRVPALVEYENDLYESLALATSRLYWALQDTPSGQAMRLSGITPLSAGSNSGALEYLQVGKRLLPIDQEANFYVPYKGPAKSFTYLSAIDLIEKKIPPEALKDKIVFVGTTAPGLLDLRATPVSGIYPGVEIHANLTSALLNSDTTPFLHRPTWLKAVEVIAVLLMGLLLSLVLPWLSPLGLSLATAASLAATTAAGWNLWESGLVATTATGMLLIATLFVSNMAYGFFIESRSKRQFTELFGQYVPPELVQQMAENPDQYDMSGRRKELTVLFSDVRGFSTISESLSPTDLALYINEYLTSMSRVIREHGGTLDKYIGDAIMAFWGAPVDEPRHALQAVQAAMAMRNELYVVREKFEAKGWPNLNIGIGLSSGDMTVGDMGSKVRKAYTVMGDAVNLGSRLEGLTKTYAAWTLVPEATMLACPEFEFRQMDRVRVKGKNEPVPIYEPVCFKESVTPEVRREIELWNQAIDHYYTSDWDPALQCLQTIEQEGETHERIDIFRTKILKFKASPPPADWGGITNFETK